MKTTPVPASIFKFVHRSIERTLATLVCLAFLFFLSAAAANAQISITTLNTPHTGNFDGMGTGDLTITDEITGALLGFHAYRVVGNANPNFIGADDGLEPTSGFKNYGAALHFDRAFGTLPGPDTGSILFGIRFVNNSGSPISSFTVTYTGEQWRDGGNLTPQTLTFAYRKDVSVNDLTTGVYTAIPALSFVSPNAGSAGPLDGNAAPNRAVMSATFAVIVMPGEEIMLRWENADASGDDQGLAIDDLSVTPNGASTAADVSISGRVVDASGRGVARTRVILMGGELQAPVFAITNPFGYYRFENIQSGEAYLLRVEAKRYRFENPVIFVNLNDNLTGLDFVANP